MKNKIKVIPFTKFLSILFFIAGAFLVKGENVYAYTIGQDVGDTLSNISTIGGLRRPIQKFNSPTGFTARRIIVYPEIGSNVYTDCTQGYANGGSPSLGIWDSGFTVYYDGFTSASVGADSTGACYYDYATGVTIATSTDYYLGHFTNNLNAPEYYGTTAGGANYGYRTTAPATVLGTLSIQNMKYYVSDSTSYTPPAPITNFNTRITQISPSNNSTTTATTTTFTVEYYLNSTTDTGKNPTSVQITYYNANAVGGIQTIIIPITTPVYDELVQVSTSTVLLNNNNYRWFARLNGTTVSAICQNPLITIVYCAFQNASAGLNQIATTPTWNFTIGTNPLSSITAYANSIFNTVAGVDDVDIMGECAFVATSTCDATSPSTYSGCFINAGIALLCPSQSVMSNATTSIFNALQNKKVFATIFESIEPLQNITSSTTPAEGSDITVNIDSLGQETTTMFSWSEAREFMYNTIGEEAMNILIFVEWIVITVLTIWVALKFF